MKVGFGARLAIAFALLAAVTALVTAGFSSAATNGRVKSDIDRFLEERAADIAEGRRQRPQVPGARPGSFGVIVDAASAVRSAVDADAVVQILDRRGDVLISSGVRLPVTEVDRGLLERRDPPILRTITLEGEQYRIITRHIDGGGAVQVAQSLRTTNALLGSIRNGLVVVGIAMSLVAALIGWVIASSTTRPLRQLTRSVEAVAASNDLNTPIALDRSDEIGRLSAEFESLLHSLGQSRDQQQRLVQDAAHELRTPLTSVRANIDFLERASDLDDETRRATLASIKTELGELTVILAEVVELATESRDGAAFESLDLATVAEVAIAQFELRSGRPVVRDLAPSPVHGDHLMLVRAASNLIGNADKYSPADRPITVHVRGGALWVTDQGPGIDPDDRPHVFERFYRSARDRSAPGSGLGLAIVAKTATDHGGTAWVTDAPGGGAEVGFTLAGQVAPTA